MVQLIYKVKLMRKLLASNLIASAVASGCYLHLLLAI